jgi:hypothetical protein
VVESTAIAETVLLEKEHKPTKPSPTLTRIVPSVGFKQYFPL